MAAEQTVIGIALFAVAFLWYSNECVKRGSLLWGQAFQVLAFLLILADFPIMAQLMKAEGYFDIEDLLMEGLWYVVFIFMWVLVLFWIVSFVLNLLGTLRKPKFEKADQVGGNKYGS
jgi:hypothetical protein